MNLTTKLANTILRVEGAKNGWGRRATWQPDQICDRRTGLQVPLEVTGHHFSLSQRHETLIDEQTSKLERFYERITSCRVVIDGPSNHHKSGGVYKVRIHLGVPGSEITIDRQEEQDLTAAIHAAFDAARRKLQDYARTRRGEVKQH